MFEGKPITGSILIATRPLPHAVGVDGFGRDLLADVPQLDDAIVHEPEDVHHDRAAIAGFVPHEGVNATSWPSSSVRSTSSRFSGF